MKGQRPINNQVVMDHYFSILRENTNLTRTRIQHLSNVRIWNCLHVLYFLVLFRPLTKMGYRRSGFGK